MKFLSSILILCLSISSFSQNSKVNDSNYLIDANGFPKRQEKIRSNATNFVPRSTDAIVPGYEDTRVLSEINIVGEADAYPWISGDGLRLYYTNGSDSSNSLLYYSERANVDSPFQTPTLVPINVVTPKSIWLSENELEAYVTTFVSGGILVYYQRNSIVEPFGAPEEIFLNGITLGSIAGASLNSTQTELILYAAGYGVITFNRTSSNSFDYVGPLLSSSNLNTSAGQLSKDDLTYFLGINNAGFGASINQLERSTIADAFSSSALQEISDLNEPLPSNIQPTMSSDLEWVVFVRNFDGIWAGNELYISHKVSLSVIKNETKNNFTVIPNPTSGKFTITMATSLSSNEDYTIEIFDSTGKLLLENKMATEVNLSDYAAGIYFAKITGGTFSEVQKIIRN